MIDNDALLKVIRKRLFKQDGLLAIVPRVQWKWWKEVIILNEKPWIRETYLIGREQLVATRTVCVRHTVQYDYFVPTGTGAEQAGDVIKRIVDSFKPATSLQDGSLQLQIEESTEVAGAEPPDSTWDGRSAQITFRSYGFFRRQ